MTSREALRRLQRHREKLRTFSVRHIAVFGSTARDEATLHSDVDVLVEFEPKGAPDFFQFVGMKEELEAMFGRRVDLKTANSLSPYFRDRVLAEAVRLHDAA